MTDFKKEKQDLLFMIEGLIKLAPDEAVVYPLRDEQTKAVKIQGELLAYNKKCYGTIDSELDNPALPKLYEEYGVGETQPKGKDYIDLDGKPQSFKTVVYSQLERLWLLQDRLKEISKPVYETSCFGSPTFTLTCINDKPHLEKMKILIEKKYPSTITKIKAVNTESILKPFLGSKAPVDISHIYYTAKEAVATDGKIIAIILGSFKPSDYKAPLTYAEVIPDYVDGQSPKHAGYPAKVSTLQGQLKKANSAMDKEPFSLTIGVNKQSITLKAKNRSGNEYNEPMEIELSHIDRHRFEKALKFFNQMKVSDIRITVSGDCFMMIAEPCYVILKHSEACYLV